jgi:hypothetical protein
MIEWVKIEQRNAVAATVAASTTKTAPATERAHATPSDDEVPRHSSESVLSVPSSSTSFGSSKNERPFPPLSSSSSGMGASASSAGSLEKAHEEMIDFLESCGLAYMKDIFHLTNNDNSSGEGPSSAASPKSGDVLSRGEFFQEAPFEPAATVATAVTTRALKPLSLGQLLVLITRHGELSKVIAK